MKKRTPTDERGFASLVIAIVLVLILSLMTVGFAELMRHEQRSALDKQLSSQAYYAAESGVNDAAKAISDGYLGAKTGCLPGQGVDNNPAYATGLADLSSNIVDYRDSPTSAYHTSSTYSCLLINPYPPNLYYNPITTEQSRTMEFTAIDSSGTVSPVTSIKISWQDAQKNTSFSGDCTSSNNFTSMASWGHVGVLRAMIVPISSSTLDRSSLTNAAFTGFFCPNNGGGGSPPPGNANYGSSLGAGNAGIIADGNCSSSSTQPQYCNVTVTNLPPNQATFFMNLRSIYASTQVTITAYNGGTALRLKDAQTLVDSTGKAQDVLRRVQVRIPSTNGYDIPDGVHGDVCKQLDLDPDNTTSNGAGCDSSVLSL